MTDNWTATLAGCDPMSLNGVYVYEKSDGSLLHYYSRAASNTEIPAELKIRNIVGENTNVDITITVKPGEWLLYDKETGLAGSNGKSKVTFTDGTVFEIKNSTATTTTTTLDVSNCPRGLNGTYTKTDPIKYIKAGTTSSLASYVTCDFQRNQFAIGVNTHEIQCGKRKYTGNSNGPVSIGEPTTSNANSVQKNMVINFTKKTGNSWCTFHPYSHLLFNPSGNIILDGTKKPTIWCYKGSDNASDTSRSIECEKTGKWVTKSGGSEIVRCAPGLQQQYINVSGFSGSEAILNGSYKQNANSNASKFAWVNTSNDRLNIVVSGQKAHTLELKRDASLSVSYYIDISNYKGTTTLPTLTVVSADTKSLGQIGVRAVFSSTESGQRECAPWTECASSYDRHVDDPILQNAESCAPQAAQCAPTTSSGTSTFSLKTSADATAVPLYTLVSGAAHLYGRDAGGTLYIVFPSKREAKKAQVLLIKTGTNNSEVKSAALGTDAKTWTITDADKPKDTSGPSGPSGTDKPKETDGPSGPSGPSGTDKPKGTDGPSDPSGTGKPNGANGPSGPSGTDKPNGASDTKSGVPAPSQSPCGDLIACAVTRDLDSCAAAAVACTVTPGTATHTLDHGEKKGIKLFPLSPGVLYGTGAEAAYVIVTTSGKSKLLVAPLDKTTATALDVDLKGTVWTSKSDNKMTWIIIGSVAGGFVLLIIIAIMFWLATRGHVTGPQSGAPSWSRYRPARSRVYPDVGPAANATAATTTTTTSAAGMSSVLPR